ncbi:MAG TPA: radical SAM protein [Euryarchaeota archaeon]|nr:radical SAM protein [Euryarchaeota archaeon]
MEDNTLSLRKKAELICSGRISVPPGTKIPFPTSRSSAGPGAGGESIVIAFSGRRVKMEVDRNCASDLELRQVGKGGYEVLRDGEVFVTDVRIVPTLCHAPDQAFVCLGRSCRLGCLYCNIDSAGKQELTVQKAFDLIVASSKHGKIGGIAVTSGVTSTVEQQVEDVAALIARVKRAFPMLKVGAEPLITSRDQLVKLSKAGADEIKVNLEAARGDIFRMVCPNRDYDLTIESIGWASEIFGRGAVTSNIIVGFGEDDSDVENAVSMLAGMGSVANIRRLRLDDANRPRLEKALGPLTPVDEERLVALGRRHAETLRKNGLSPRKFETMCFPCASCDIVPDVDL